MVQKSSPSEPILRGESEGDGSRITSRRRVPDVTVERLSIYSRILAALQAEGRETASSALLAERGPYAAAQIRRDLAWFGQFGTRGKGYNIATLRRRLDEILGVHLQRRVALVGVGNLGTALLGYTGFGEHNFQIVAAFDSQPEKVGTVTPQGVLIHPISNFADAVESHGIEIAILAVPAKAAQAVFDLVVRAGVRAVLNFAPVHLDVPSFVRLRNVDLSIELEALSYYLEREAETD